MNQFFLAIEKKTKWVVYHKKRISTFWKLINLMGKIMNCFYTSFSCCKMSFHVNELSKNLFVISIYHFYNNIQAGGFSSILRPCDQYPVEPTVRLRPRSQTSNASHRLVFLYFTSVTFYTYHQIVVMLLISQFFT